MNPPREYFELIIQPAWNNVGAPEIGAQRIGFQWFRFTDENALARLIEDGGLTEIPPSANERIKELEGKIERLQRKIDLAINELE